MTIATESHPVLLAVARFDRPHLRLGASRDELVAWAERGLDGGGGTREDCETAIRRMIPTKHDGLVKALARRAAYGYEQKRAGRPLDRDDLIGAGRLGLLKAALKFDVDRGFRFATYATYLVRNEIGLEIESAAAGPPGEVWLEGIDVDRRTGRGGGEGEGEGAWREVDPVVLATLLGAIRRPRDREIVLARFGVGGVGPLTLEAAGATYGVTKERARQILAEGLGRLRDAARHRGIEIEHCYREADGRGRGYASNVA